MILIHLEGEEEREGEGMEGKSVTTISSHAFPASCQEDLLLKDESTLDFDTQKFTPQKVNKITPIP